MNQHCILEHDGDFPQMAIKDFCTNVNCKNKLACTICKYQFHQGHVLKPLTEFQNFAARQFALKKSLAMTDIISEMNGLVKNLTNYVQFLLQNQTQVTDYQNLPPHSVTNEILDDILQPNPLLKSKEELTNIKNILEGCVIQLNPQPLKQQGQVISIQEQGACEGCTIPQKREGFGILEITEPNQRTIYKGNWKQDLRHGFGKEEIHFTGSDIKFEKYEGEWVNNLKHGFGTLTVQKQCGELTIYRGEFMKNLQKGFGYVIEIKDNKQSVIYSIFEHGRQDGVSLRVEDTKIFVDYYKNGEQQNAHEFYVLDKSISPKSLVFTSGKRC